MIISAVGSVPTHTWKREENRRRGEKGVTEGKTEAFKSKTLKYTKENINPVQAKKLNHHYS